MKFSLNPNTESALHLTKSVPAPRARVFEAWTNPAELKKWWGSDELTLQGVEVAAKVGGALKFNVKSKANDVSQLSGEFREIRAPEMLVYTWNWKGKEAGETLVTVEFRDKGKSTELSITQENLPTPGSRERHTKHWLGCIERLAKFVA